MRGTIGFIALALIVSMTDSCHNSAEPSTASPYRLELKVLGGDPNVTRDFGDTIKYQINDSIHILRHVLLPWRMETTINAGDSIKLRVFDPDSDCCTLPPNADGYAIFARIAVYVDTVVGTCSSAGRNVPSLHNEWLQAPNLVVKEQTIRHTLALPPALRNDCDILSHNITRLVNPNH